MATTRINTSEILPLIRRSRDTTSFGIETVGGDIPIEKNLEKHLAIISKNSEKMAYIIRQISLQVAEILTAIKFG
jgi:hypothetical protein